MMYQELVGKIEVFVNGLEDRGLKKGDYFVLFFGNMFDFVIVFIGVLKVGVVVIFVNLVYIFLEIVYMLKNGDVKVIVGIDFLIFVFESLYGLLLLLEYIIISQIVENVLLIEDF